MRLLRLMASVFLLSGLATFAWAGDQATQTRVSQEGHYEVTIESQLKPLQLGRIHTWKATVKTPDGQPVSGLEIQAGGGMPVHNHGFPTQPQVTAQPEEGVYLVEGVKFSMRGPWLLLLDISAEDGTDSVAFDIRL